jgi:putative ABC transport system permease protein
MTSLFQDLKYTLRELRKSPGFTLVAIAILALGIGANIAIFSLVDEIWLRPMPVPHSERLMRIFTSNPSSEGVVANGYSSYPDFLSIRGATKTLSGAASLERRGALLDTGQENKLITAAVVSNNFFDVLAPVPALGRDFSEAEARAPGARTVMLSYPFWKQQFHADPGVPGKTVVLDRQEVLVAGILPRGFRGTDPLEVPDVWIPINTWIELTGDRARLDMRGLRDYELFARLSPGAALSQANAEVAELAGRLAREFPRTNSRRQMSVVPESRSRGGAAARLSEALLGIAALVLLIACVNVAGLLLARAEYRRHELATRVALGASRLRLSRQLLSETVLLAALAAGSALLVGGYLIVLLPRLLPDIGFSAQIDAHMSGRVLLFAGLSAAVSLLLFGLLPAWQASGTAPVNALKQQGALGGRSHARMRSGLVASQVAVSLVLAVSGGLLMRSLLNAENADPGFDAHQNMLVLELIPGFGARGAGAERAFVEEARRRLEALPGVAGTAAGMRIPFGLSGSGATRKVFFPGAPRIDQDGIPIHYDPVSDRFFELLGTRLLRGRAIDVHDAQEHARVIVVNQTMASRFWPGRDPIGERVRLDKPDGDLYEVVGVAQNSVNADFAEGPMPYLYTPMSAEDYGELTLIVKTRPSASSLAGAVRSSLRGLNRDVPIIYMATMREHMRMATSEERMTTSLIVSLGGLGLLLVAVGLYGLTSFLVGRRAREIGIRLALGAEPRSIFELVIGRALYVTGVGVAIGAAGAVAATRALRSFLFGVGPGDAWAFVTGIAVLAAVTCAAAFVPARRATRVNPVTVLRAE